MQTNGKVSALSQASFGQAVEIVFSQNAYAEDGSIAHPETKPVALPLVPAAVMDLLNSLNHGVIGLVFVFSATIW